MSDSERKLEEELSVRLGDAPVVTRRSAITWGAFATGAGLLTGVIGGQAIGSTGRPEAIFAWPTIQQDANSTDRTLSDIAEQWQSDQGARTVRQADVAMGAAAAGFGRSMLADDDRRTTVHWGPEFADGFRSVQKGSFNIFAGPGALLSVVVQGFNMGPEHNPEEAEVTSLTVTDGGAYGGSPLTVNYQSAPPDEWSGDSENSWRLSASTVPLGKFGFPDNRGGISGPDVSPTEYLARVHACNEILTNLHELYSIPLLDPNAYGS